MYEFEQAARREGYAAVCGVDEAGRGPLAGDVYAAAVILPPGLELAGVNDSKKLSEKRREALYGVITEQAAAWCVDVYKRQAFIKSARPRIARTRPISAA